MKLKVQLQGSTQNLGGTKICFILLLKYLYLLLILMVRELLTNKVEY